jgi:putative methionine-R-sulfoxide reductase with GAF domain/predicted Ser/Thr protein kinase
MPRQSDRPTGPVPDHADPGTVDKALTPGSMLGPRYRIVSILGYGGMGVVYRAHDLTLDQEIALKRLRPDRISTERREILRREIILSRKVTHENVCRIYDLQEIDGVEYVSMEYLKGKSLKEMEEGEGILPLGRGLAIAKGICRGLAAVHRIGVLHRDLKPENVIVDEEGRARLMDFGIAIDRAQSLREKSGSVPGTPQFLAPELLRGAAPDAKTDIYALGVLLYEMFTGRVPFDHPDTSVLVKKVLHEEAPLISSLRPDLPAELAEVMQRAIAKDPAARYSSADEVANAIEAYEGLFLDQALRNVSIAQAKSVKLMVILEANKALASTFDPTEILRIILKTATEETAAERGTIFLVEEGTRTLVSQILEGGTVSPIRVPWGQGIAGACAAEGKSILTIDVESDPRHDRGPDSTSGFKTTSLLAAPMKTPDGEVVGVIEVLNKRRGAFSKEDEEFLTSVAEHAALAVLRSRQHRDAVEDAARETREEILYSLRTLLYPPDWPETPGFESGPLRWRSTTGHLLGFGRLHDERALTIFLAEDDRAIAAGLCDLLAAMAQLRAHGAEPGLGSVIAAAGERIGRITAARLTEKSAEFFSVGTPLPFLFRSGRPHPFPTHEEGRLCHSLVALEPRDLILLSSSGLDLVFNEPEDLERQMRRAARLAEIETLSEAFTDLVSKWKSEGRSPGERDILLLGARRVDG